MKSKQEEAKKSNQQLHANRMIHIELTTVDDEETHILCIVDCESNTAHRTANTAYVDTNESNDELS